MPEDERSRTSMAERDFDRIATILSVLDNTRYELHLRKIEFIGPHYAALRSLWANIKPVMGKENAESMDAEMTSAFKEIISYESGGSKMFPQVIADHLFTIGDRLMLWRQDKGMGISMEKRR
jgi:hypothetical protein